MNLCALFGLYSYLGYQLAVPVRPWNWTIIEHILKNSGNEIYHTPHEKNAFLWVTDEWRKKNRIFFLCFFELPRTSLSLFISSNLLRTSLCFLVLLGKTCFFVHGFIEGRSEFYFFSSSQTSLLFHPMYRTSTKAGICDQITRRLRTCSWAHTRKFTQPISYSSTRESTNILNTTFLIDSRRIRRLGCPLCYLFADLFDFSFV